MKAKGAGADALRITVQYRTKRGRAYELTFRETVLAVHISRPEERAPSDGWHVEARIGSADGPSLADGWGTTAAEALGEAARAWTARAPAVTGVDWEVVARELHAVHAV